MNYLDTFASQLRQTFSGSPWHGPSLRDSLEGIDADLAARKPPTGAHSIWELTLHIQAWMEFVIDCLEGREASQPRAGDFPPVASPPDSRAWASACNELAACCERLTRAVAGFNASRLEELVPTKKYTFAAMLDGAVWHCVYHAGQISLLKRMLEGSRRPA